MKRFSCLFLAVLLLCGMTAGCRRNMNEPAPTNPTDPTGQTDPTGNQNQAPTGALEILQTVWASYGEDERFAVIGGDPENMVDGAPGDFSLADADAVTYSLALPAELLPQIDEAASLVHGMLSNNFTCGVVHLVAGTDVSAFTRSVYEAVQNSQWMCGMPDHVIVAVVAGEYVLMAYGLDNVISQFQAKLMAAYPNTQIVYSAAITG